MNEIMNFMGQQAVSESFDEIRISIASPEQIRSWSYGEVKKPEKLEKPTPENKFIQNLKVAGFAVKTLVMGILHLHELIYNHKYKDITDYLP